MQVVFAYNLNRLTALEVTLSAPRLASYISKVGGDKEKALQLYVYNVAVTEAFYTPIHGLEVPLRNAMSVQLANRISGKWYIPGSVALFGYALDEMLEDGVQKLRREQKALTSDNMIAVLNFGFWVALLGPKYETDLWRPCLRHSFPFRPARWERKKVHNTLDAIRRFRNRVAHHEPILGRNLQNEHDRILAALSWICPDTRDWVAAHSRVPELLKARP